VDKILENRPDLSTAEATALAADLFDLRGEASELVSDRDRNFRIRTAEGSHTLKIANGTDGRDVLELQNALLRALADLPYETPCVETSASGDDIVEWVLGDTPHFVRLLTWVPGTPLARVRPWTEATFHGLGRVAGELRRCLAGFEHDAASRPLSWNLDLAPDTVAARLGLIAAPDRRELVAALLARYVDTTAPRLAELRRGVLHNDLNDHNLLLADAADLSGAPRPITGLIDVGDALEGAVVGDVAVAAAYALLGRDDPLRVAAAVARGCHEVFPLEEEELGVLFGLATMRLALSVTIGAEQIGQEPDNEYLQVSQEPAWDALERIAGIDPAFAEFSLRGACGLEPCPQGAVVRRWLRETTTDFAPVVGQELAGEHVHVFDLSVGSTAMGGGAPGEFPTAALTERLFGQMRRAGRSVGIGRYDEARCWYGGELFAAPGDEAPCRRTVHLGVDVFLEAGAAVCAPLAGRVVSAATNEGRLDYGPTLILEHEPEPGVVFWTLYGHLDAGFEVEVGQSVAAGERLAALGDFPANGDWPPHLHFQVVSHRLDFETDYPGVCAPHERHTWKSLSPDPQRLLGLDPEQVAPQGLGAGAIRALRDRHIGPSLSISYRRPLTIVRGFMQTLYDIDGQPFLDAVNNVPHVGHSHPHVVAAANAQNEVLNTNTRYLHENLVRYAERLAATLPEPLEVCYFACSGSEANELALRMARTATGRREVIGLEGGYHGNTAALIDVSPYKHDGPGGGGAPEWVHIAAMPDPYRGAHGGGPDAGAAYAEDVARACRDAAERGGVAAFLAEPLLGCGGQIVPPPGYFEAAFAHVREAGGVCIADEVQIGFGRAGSHFWAFETQGVVPDIVTLGKPIGNGFPLAAVVTTREIAAAFANGMEYFNTFGGNPVACAVGNAVLDVIEHERLQDNARQVGERFLAGLGELAGRHPIVGDARGLGLYLGAELVRDRATLEPAAAAASYVINRVRDHGILISTDGPLHNVLKFKPPLCFSAADADRLLEVLDQVLAEDAVVQAVR
jgi:4-aminobutyrate aminotransferase-like enzyme/Ser/Thr protein kinase RdoA (MazF antagonist)